MSPTSPAPLDRQEEFEPFFNLAHVTGDGVVVGVSDKRQVHPVYGTDAYEMELKLPLFKNEAEQYLELTSARIGDVRCHVRSAIAQMGNDAFHRDTLEHFIRGEVLMIRTLLTNLNGSKGQSVITTTRNLVHHGHEPRFMHAGLLPHHARVSQKEEMLVAQKEKVITVSSDADFYDDGSIGLPHKALYGFNDAAFTTEQIAQILMKEGGREILERNRFPVEEFPQKLQKGQFLVTGTDLRSVAYHVVLRPALVAEEGNIPAFQTESPVLHAGRTDTPNHRQLEVIVQDDYEVPLRDTRVVAEFYRASVIAQPGH